MIFGVGIDIENHHRFQKYEKLSLDNKLELFFTRAEIENYKNYNSHLCYAVSFCGKEALYKAFSSGQSALVPALTEFEFFFHDVPGAHQTSVKFSGNARAIIEKHNIQLPVEYNYAIEESVVVFETILSCKPK